MTVAAAKEFRHHESMETALSHDAAAGVAAGQIAGLIMAGALMLVYGIFLGKSPLYPVQIIGSFAYGNPALVGTHFPAIAAGLLLHQLGPSLFWGLVFGFTVNAFSARRGRELIAVGLLVGVLSQVLDVYVIMPPAMRALHGYDIWAEEVPMVWSWIAHLVFGLGLVNFAWIHPRLTPWFRSLDQVPATSRKG